MRKLREWISRLGGFFCKQGKDREFDEELKSHLQFHIEDNLRSGMTPEAARRAAMIKLGGLDSAKEAYRDQRGELSGRKARAASRSRDSGIGGKAGRDAQQAGVCDHGLQLLAGASVRD